MNLILRILFSTLLGIAIGGLIHIGMILYIPYYSQNKSFSYIHKLSENQRSVELPQEWVEKNLPYPDPYMNIAACSFPVGKDIIKVSVPRSPIFQSLSLYDSQGRVLISATDRAATGNNIDIFIGTSSQIETLLKDQEENKNSTTQGLTAVLDEEQGFAVLRVLSPSPSFKDMAQKAALQLACSAL